MAMADSLNPGLLVDDMPFVLLVVRVPDFSVVWVNTHAENLFGQSRKSLAGQNLTFLTANTDELHGYLSRVKDRGAVNIHGLRVVSGDENNALYTASAFSHGDDIALMLIPEGRKSRKVAQDELC